LENDGTRVLKITMISSLPPLIALSPYTKGLGNLYTKIICPISINNLIDQGYLVDADVYGPSQPDMSDVKTVGDDFNQKQVGEKVMDKSLVASILDTWHKVAKDKSTLCFATNILHSKYIVEEFQLAGVNAVHIDCYIDAGENKEVIESFRRGEITILSSVTKLTKGFDAPNAEVAIIARPTKSMALHHQIIGRVLRPSTGKDKAIILDHAGNFERLGFHTDEMPNNLCKLKKGDKRKKEKEKPLPKPCPKCHCLKPVRATKCPQCGFETKSQNEIKTR